MRKKWWETDDLGRYCNHSLTPNTTVVSQGDKLELKANRKIEYGEEVLVDYRKITEFTGYIPEINF
ncbi:SET domain protein [compost metagenome]